MCMQHKHRYRGIRTNSRGEKGGARERERGREGERERERVKVGGEWSG